MSDDASAYRIGLGEAFSGSSYVYMSGLFASRDEAERALAEEIGHHQGATTFLDAWPLDVLVIEHHRGGRMVARVDLRRHLRVRVSDGRAIELGEDDLAIEGIGDRHEEGYDEYYELLMELAEERLSLEATIAWDEVELGEEGAQLDASVTSVRLENGFEHPLGWIGGDDERGLRRRLEPG